MSRSFLDLLHSLRMMKLKEIFAENNLHTNGQMFYTPCGPDMAFACILVEFALVGLVRPTGC